MCRPEHIRVHFISLVSACLLLTSCGEESGDETAEAGEEVVLTDVEDWEPVGAAEDPFAEHRPEEVDCDGWWVEDDLLEVSTLDCNHLSLGQPLRADLTPDDRLEGLVSHDALYFENGPARAHLAVAVDGRVVWESSLAIPSDAGYVEISAPIDVPAEAGAPVVVHLRNHGSNHWRWHELERAPRRE